MPRPTTAMIVARSDESSCAANATGLETLAWGHQIVTRSRKKTAMVLPSDNSEPESRNHSLLTALVNFLAC